MPNLANRYQLGEIIYSDAQIVAYLAHDELLNRTVTVELLQAGRADEPQRAARLIAKARQSALSNLPHVAALYDQHTVDGRPFLVLEEPIGPALSEVAPVPAAQIVMLVREVAATFRAALAQQQALPVTNPFTVRLGPDSRVQIIDLGLDQPPPNQTTAVQQLGHLISAALNNTSDQQTASLKRLAEGAGTGAYASIDALLAALQQIQERADQPTTVLPRVMPTIDVRAHEQDNETLIVAPPQRPPSQRLPSQRLPSQRRWGLWAALGAGIIALLLGAMVLRPGDETAQQPVSSAAASAAAEIPNASAGASPANGTLFTVTTNNGQSLIVRSGPGRNFSRITSIPNGTTVEVIEGPQTADGFNWVHIRTANVEGWCVSEALRRR